MAKDHGKDGSKGDKPAKAKDPAREAQREKRRTAVLALAKENPLKFHQRVSFKEAKVLKVNGIDGKPIENWKSFCESKAKWAAEYWKDALSKPQMSEKSINRKKAAFQKLKERLAKYEAELAGLVEEEEKKA